MLGYLKKFTIDILPSIIATIVGAFIVHHYIIPAATPKSPAAAVANAAPKADEAAPEKDGFAKGVAEKSAIEKTAEKAAEKSGESAPADSRKRHNAARAAARPDSSEPASAEERRDANNLARAAIERLRGSEARTVAVAPPQSAPPTVQAQPSLPALPPPISKPEVFTAGTGPVISPSIQPVAPPVRSADATKPTPPEAIPAAPPLALHDDIVTTATSRATTVADDVMSAAKSMIHAVLPR